MFDKLFFSGYLNDGGAAHKPPPTSSNEIKRAYAEALLRDQEERWNSRSLSERRKEAWLAIR